MFNWKFSGTDLVECPRYQRHASEQTLTGTFTRSHHVMRSKAEKMIFFSRPQQWVFDLHDDAVRLFIFKQSSLSLVIWLGEIQFSCVGPDFFTSWLGCWWVPTVPEMNAKQFYKWGGLLMRYFLRASGVTNLRSGLAFYDDLERLSCCSGESFF